jgi:hypothetical protein
MAATVYGAAGRFREPNRASLVPARAVIQWQEIAVPVVLGRERHTLRDALVRIEGAAISRVTCYETTIRRRRRVLLFSVGTAPVFPWRVAVVIRWLCCARAVAP